MHLNILLVAASALKQSSTLPCSEQDYPGMTLRSVSLNSLPCAKYALFRGSQILCTQAPLPEPSFTTGMCKLPFEAQHDNPEENKTQYRLITH